MGKTGKQATGTEVGLLVRSSHRTREGHPTSFFDSSDIFLFPFFGVKTFFVPHGMRKNTLGK
jgi:hypothetical protein